MSTHLQMYRGDTMTFTVACTRDNSAVSLSGGSATFTAKNSRSDPIASAVIRLSTSLGGVSITNASGGILTVTISPANTSGLTAQTDLEYDVEVTEASGRVSTVLSGKLRILLDVTA